MDDGTSAEAVPTQQATQPSHSEVSRSDGWIRRAEVAIYDLDRQSRTLWAYALLLFVVADTVLTIVSLQYLPVHEIGPVASALVARFGVMMLVPLKLAAVDLFAIFWWITPRPHRVGIPVGLIAIGSVVTVWNGAVMGMAALV